jgi:hypothetical protein
MNAERRPAFLDAQRRRQVDEADAMLAFRPPRHIESRIERSIAEVSPSIPRDEGRQPTATQTRDDRADGHRARQILVTVRAQYRRTWESSRGIGHKGQTIPRASISKPRARDDTPKCSATVGVSSS